MPLATPATLVGGADSQGPIYHNRLSFLGDDAYPTGGSVNFNAFVRVLFSDTRSVLYVVGTDGTNDYEYDIVNDLLIARVMATGAEVANTTDLSSNTVTLAVISK